MNSTDKYVQLRSRMKTGDVIAFQGSDAGAKLIRKATKSPYSHVGIVIKIREASISRVFILESVVKNGVILLPLRRKLEGYKGKAWWCQINKQRISESLRSGYEKRILGWGLRELGKLYDKKLIKSIAIQKILRKRKIKKEDEGQYICSELVAMALKKVNLIYNKLIAANHTPKDIVELSILKKPKEIL